MHAPSRLAGYNWPLRLLVFAIAFGVAFGVGALFAELLQAGGDWNVGLPWERSFMLGLERPLPTALDLVMLGLPWLGTNLTVMPITAVVLLWLVATRRRWDVAVHLVGVQAGSLVLNAVMKDMYDRPRPQLWEHRGQYAWASYPSGHMIVSVAVFFTVAILLHRERGWRWPYLLAVALLLINMYSRVYLGVHWPSDVLGGVLIGLAWLFGTLLAFRPPPPPAVPIDPVAGGRMTPSGTAATRR